MNFMSSHYEGPQSMKSCLFIIIITLWIKQYLFTVLGLLSYFNPLLDTADSTMNMDIIYNSDIID